MRAHVVTARNVVRRELSDGIGRGGVLVDLPSRLRGIRVLFVRIQRQAQREHDLRAVRRHVEIAHGPHALGNGLRDVGFHATGARLSAHIEVAAGDRGNEVAYVDVRGRYGLLDIGKRVVGDAGSQSLATGNSGRMPALGTRAPENDQQRQDDCCESHETVTSFTRTVVVHLFRLPADSMFGSVPACMCARRH